MLHLHTHTMVYRVARIEAITGLDLGDPDDRLVVHVAAKIIESQGCPPAPSRDQGAGRLPILRCPGRSGRRRLTSRCWESGGRWSPS
jgi:hypothetical protein